MREIGREIQLFVRGEIDLATAPQLRQHFLDAVVSRREHVELDCSDMTFIDSSGLRLVIEMGDILRAQGRHLRVTHLTPSVARTIDVLGLSDRLQVTEVPTDELPVIG